MRGKVVAITGAGRGIGRAAALTFAEAGAKVVLLSRTAADLRVLAQEIGDSALPLSCDVADAEAVSAALEQAEDWGGRLDVLVNNAGMIDPIARLSEADVAAFSRAVDVNLKGVFHGMRAALPRMRRHGGGTILTVSSGAAHSPLEGWGAYCSAKAGAAMLTRVAHLEEAWWGLRVMGLSPGTVATDMQVRIKASGINPVSQLDPAVHVPADWPAKALLWMCSADADDWLGQEVSLRDEVIRRRAGLIA